MTMIQLLTLGVSLIGATAWVPHFLKFIRRPQLTIIPATVCQVGFTELGPIFNLNLAITSQHEGVLITSIEFKLRHESGDTYLFPWHEIGEIKGYVATPDARSQPIHHMTDAIAIKILPTDFKDLYLRNRLLSHTQGLKRYDEIFNRERRNRINANRYNSDEFYATPAAQNIQQFLQSQMIWKKGRYYVEMSVENVNKAITKPVKFSFALSETDIIDFQNNCNNIPKFIKNSCLTDSEAEGVDDQLTWHFSTIDIRK